MKISVVIPAYNAEGFVGRAIESVLSQTYQNYEIIVVNDGSSDNTEKIVEGYIHSGNSIRLISIPNGGLANARNIGMKECSGDLYINLDADDYIEADTFSNAIDVFKENEKIDICFYGYKSFIEQNKFFDYYEETKHYLKKPVKGVEAFFLRLKRYIWICQGNAIYKMKLIKENNITNNKGYNQGEDMYFISKCLLNANEVFCFEKDNFCCMYREDSMNNSEFNESFFEVMYLLLKLKKEVELGAYEDKKTIIDYIDIEYVAQYLALIKRIARLYKIDRYKKKVEELPYTLDQVDYKKIKKLMPRMKILEVSIFSFSRTIYYLFTKVHDIRRK